MEMSVRVVCTKDVAAGFGLAGVTAHVAEASTAEDALRRLSQDPSVGIVLVEDRLRDAIPRDLLQRLDRRGTPVVVPFPSPRWEARSVAEEYVLAILRQAVGYRVRPR
jgi:vacuolar-type H+-ATPase subunit F/Vma7